MRHELKGDTHQKRAKRGDWSDPLSPIAHHVNRLYRCYWGVDSEEEWVRRLEKVTRDALSDVVLLSLLAIAV